MVREDVISVCPQTRFSPAALLSKAVGLTPAYWMTPSLLCQLASGLGQCENSRRLGVAGGRSTQFSSLLWMLSSAWLHAPCDSAPLDSSFEVPVSCDFGFGRWKPRCLPLAFSAIAHLQFALLACLTLSSFFTLVPNSLHWFPFTKKW